MVIAFLLSGAGIEYCLSAVCVGDEVHFFVSRLDRETYVVRTPSRTVLRLLDCPP